MSTEIPRDIEDLLSRHCIIERISSTHNNGSPLNTDLFLLVINTENNDPQWFIMSRYHARHLKNPPETLHCVDSLKVSPGGEYCAVLSVGEGHPLVKLFSLAGILADKRGEPLFKIDPYPGSVRLVGWKGDLLYIKSDMLLTHRTAEYDRVPAALILFSDEEFTVNATTGEIKALSNNLEDPVRYYGVHLTTTPDHLSPGLELEALETLGDPRAVAYLLEALKHQRFFQHRVEIRNLLEKLAARRRP